MVKVRIKKGSESSVSYERKPKKHLKCSPAQLANLKPFKKGNNANPNGRPKNGPEKRVSFWPHIVRFGNMTEAQVNAAKRTEPLTMFQLGAIAFVEKFKAGSLPHQLEILNREIGPPIARALTSPEEQASLAREYLRQMLSTVPLQSTEKGPNQNVV